MGDATDAPAPERAARVPKRHPGSRIHAELAAGIGTRILDGTYPPGTLLPNEAEWGQIFGASRTAVREAIKTLNGKGLLVSRTKIGWRVEPRERWNLLDRDVMAWHCAAMDKTAFLSRCRKCAASWNRAPPSSPPAAARPSNWPQLEAALEGMRNAADAEAMVAPDVRFHLALLACANNELLAPFGIIIEQALANMFAFTSRHNAKPGHVIPMHEDVVKAIAAQKPEAARKAMPILLDDTDHIIGPRRRSHKTRRSPSDRASGPWHSAASFAHSLAPTRQFAIASASSSRTTLPGAPITRELSGMTLPSVISALAPIRQFLPISRMVEDGRPHADQRIVADRAAMQHGLVADGAVCADGQRRAHVGVQHAAILHVGVLAHRDQFIVAAQHRAEPDAGISRQPHLADDARHRAQSSRRPPPAVRERCRRAHRWSWESPVR